MSAWFDGGGRWVNVSTHGMAGWDKGCRCTKCTKAARARAYRKAKATSDPGMFGPLHGTTARYITWGCRCTRCAAATYAAQQARHDDEQDTA